MPLIKPKERVVSVGDEEICGIVGMRALQYISAEEREYISNAIADRPTKDQLAATLVDFAYKGRQGYKKGDLLDYLLDVDKVAPVVRQAIKSSSAYADLLESAAYSNYIEDGNTNILAELKAFLELRVDDDELRDSIKTMSLKALGTPGEFCVNLKLFDYINIFYRCEQQGAFYRPEYVDEVEMTAFLRTRFPDEPMPTLETDSQCSIPSSTSPALDTEAELGDSQNPELLTSSDPQPDESSNSTTNLLPQ